MTVENEQSIQYLNFLVKQYQGVTKLITATKQRLQSLPGEDRQEDFDTLLKGRKAENVVEEGLETVKGRITRDIEKELTAWDIWDLWLKGVPGIGPWLAAELIIMFYYKFSPVCKDCGGDLEKKTVTTEDGKEINSLACVDCGKVSNKDGLLEHKIIFRDYPTISKWWAFLGRHTVDGNMPKRKSGEQSNWSTHGRTVTYHIGEQWNRQKESHPYKALLLDRKKKHQKKNSGRDKEWTLGHIQNAACSETTKIFLSHFWTVARVLDGKEVSGPYSEVILGHTNISAPFFLEGELERVVLEKLAKGKKWDNGGEKVAA